MQLILILAGPYSSCISTADIWKHACEKRDIELQVHNLDDEKGSVFAEQLQLKTFPALIHENKIIAVGHPTADDAERITSKLANLL